MDIYHIWFNLKEGVRDLEFAEAAKTYLDYLIEKDLIAAYRLTRRKLGLGHVSLPQWHITLDFKNLEQLDRAFDRVASRSGPVEGFHQAVNSKVRDIFFMLYRDFPDRQRVGGEEKF